MTEPMLVAIEATHLAGEKRGIGRYVRALLPRLLAERPLLRVILFARADDIPGLETMVAADAGLAGRADVRDVRSMASVQADLWWYPWNFIRPAPGNGPAV
ncbi:MAG TPA: hypothetical protein VE967_08610, partial [Gemmatimonadaceae bacterium]|nr:hypothetical protein [Gemmatimonadaceae bacterium]